MHTSNTNSEKIFDNNNEKLRPLKNFRKPKYQIHP